jgi:hypothetical protein
VRGRVLGLLPCKAEGMPGTLRAYFLAIFSLNAPFSLKPIETVSKATFRFLHYFSGDWYFPKTGNFQMRVRSRWDLKENNMGLRIGQNA